MYTIICEGNAQRIEKRSKFIAKAYPVQTEEAALSLIAQARKHYFDASHNVYAYRIGDRSEITRYSDDGEPSGTAGLPVLDVLRGGDIQYALIIVTRYFGGTLLGTGGLVRCYGKAAAEALAEAGVVEKILCETIHVEITYGFVGKLQHYARQNSFAIVDTEYTDCVRFIFHSEHDRADAFLKEINEITNGTAKTNISAPSFMIKKAASQ